MFSTHLWSQFDLFSLVDGNFRIPLDWQARQVEIQFETTIFVQILDIAMYI